MKVTFDTQVLVDIINDDTYSLVWLSFHYQPDGSSPYKPIDKMNVCPPFWQHFSKVYIFTGFLVFSPACGQLLCSEGRLPTGAHQWRLVSSLSKMLQWLTIRFSKNSLAETCNSLIVPLSIKITKNAPCWLFNHHLNHHLDHHADQEPLRSRSKTNNLHLRWWINRWTWVGWPFFELTFFSWAFLCWSSLISPVMLILIIYQSCKWNIYVEHAGLNF